MCSGRFNVIYVLSLSKGIEATIVGTTIADGYLEFSPIIGDMMFLSEELPPVTVSVNGIPSKCDGSCHFEWSEMETPTVSEVTPSSGECAALQMNRV